MSKVVDGGIVTAYGAAVRGGYQGTYEQFCADLANLAQVLEDLTGMSVTVTTLAEGSQATGSYADGILSLGIPKGDTGNGISSMVLNQDYTLTVTYTDGTSWTSGSIRGETGATPNLSIGTVSTLTPGSQATAQITGTAENPVLNLGIPQGAPGELTAASMAPVYSASSTYAVGDYVIYNGQLYRCTTAITTAEAWTAAHWTAAKVAEDVSDLNDALSEALSFKGIVSADSEYSDVDQIFEYGMFAIRETAINIPIEAWGTLLVMPIGNLDFSTGLYGYRKIQIFITCTTTAEKNILMRYMTNSRTWSVNWTKVIDYDIYNKLSDIINKNLQVSGFTEANFQQGGISSTGGNSSNSSRIRTAGYVSVSDCDSIHYRVSAGYRILMVFFSTNSSGNNIETTAWLTGTGTVIFPQSTNYYRMQIASLGDSTALTTADYDKATIQYGTKLTDTFNPIVKQTKWLALGDSITYGIYSTGPSTEVINIYGWVRMLANSLGYEVKTLASRGMGYTVSGQDPDNPSGDRIMISTLLDRATALTDDYNLITLAFGTNDYGQSGTNLTDVKASLSTSIQTVLVRFPSARLVVITPLNRTREGDASTKYAYNHTHTGNAFTLKELSDAIAETCATYGIECIDASDGFLLNTVNITTLLPDGIHPSYECHTLIAKNMAHFLLF